MTSLITLNTLLAFKPENAKEDEIWASVKNFKVLKEYHDDSKSSWAKGKYWLGGQVQMELDEEITLKKIVDVRKISHERFAEYGACNSAEMASICRSQRQIDEIEKIVEKYLQIYKIRIITDTLTQCTNLNTDNIGGIVGFM
jgi:hypothetical protein